MEEDPIPFYETTNPDETNINNKFLIINEYKIKKNNDNTFLDIFIDKTKDDITIKSQYYEIKITPNELFLLTKFNFKSSDECYEFIKNSFENRKIYIKDITKSIIKLVITIYDFVKRKEKDIEIDLYAQLKNEDNNMNNIINKYLELEKELNNIKEDNNNLKEEIKKMRDENMKLKEENTFIKNDINKIKDDIEFLKNNCNNGVNYLNQEMMINPNINQMNKFINPFPFNRMNMIHPQQNLRPQILENNNFLNLNNNNIQSEYDLNIIFRKNDINDDDNSKSPMLIRCSKNEKLSDVIKRYREKSGDNNLQKQFIYNTKNLDNHNLTIEELGISNNSNIFVVKQNL